MALRAGSFRTAGCSTCGTFSILMTSVFQLRAGRRKYFVSQTLVKGKDLSNIKRQNVITLHA